MAMLVLDSPFAGGVADGYPIADSTSRSQTKSLSYGVRGRDPTNGNEYVYVKAGAAIPVNSAVTVNADLADVRATSAAAQIVYGVADTAFASGDNGWLLQKGSGVCKVIGSTAINSLLVSGATGGTLALAVAADLPGRGVVQVTAEAAGLATVRLI